MRTRTEGNGLPVTEVLGSLFSINATSAVYSNLISPQFYPSYKITRDEIHPKYPYQGGPLSISSTEVQFSDFGPAYGGAYYYHPIYKKYVTMGTWSIFSRIRCTAPSGGNAPIPGDDLSTTEDYGPEAWNRFKPVKPATSMAQTIAELRDFRQLGLSKLKHYKRAIHRFVELVRKGSSNYLAIEFGWKPMLSDFLSFYHDLASIDRKIARLRKQNGKWMRRTGTLLDDDDESSSSGTSAGYTPTNFSDTFSWTSEMKTHTRVWFKGVMRYYVPHLEDPRWGKLWVYGKALGLEVSPMLIYNLTPWTWLADWFTNVGAIASNLQSQIADQVAAKYAYVMRHERTSWQKTAKGRLRCIVEYNKPPIYTAVSCSMTRVTETKCRAQASPFGFAFAFDGLSDWQASILAALGLSRLRW